MALKAVQALVVRYKQIEREIYRLREDSIERVALEREISTIRNELKQIFEQCDNVLQITKEYKRERAFQSIYSSEMEIGCLD